MMISDQSIIDLKQYYPNIAPTMDVMSSSEIRSTWGKHMEYHCHITENERMIFRIDNQGGITTNRRLFEHHGLPKQNTSRANEAIFYNADSKTWQCQICNRHSGKYDLVKIINHVNNMRNGVKKR